MTDALEDHEDTVSIGGGAITNLRFADDINGLAGEEEELAKLVDRLDKASVPYGMEISAVKTKLMTNNTSGINTETKENGQKPETVTSFKYLIIIIIINPLTARVVGAPQMILQPVFSIFPCSPLPSGTCRTPGLSIPRCCLPTSSCVCLVFFPL